MRVAVVARELNATPEGRARRRLATLVDSLASRGHSVAVVCHPWWAVDGESEADGSEPGASGQSASDDESPPEGASPARRVTVDGVRYFGVPRKRRWPFSLIRSLVGFDPDVIHTTARPAQTVAASVAGSLARSPLVVEYASPSAPTSRSDRLGLSEPAAVVTPSELVQTRVREQLRSDDHVRILPTSVDVDRIHAIDPVGEDDAVFAAPLDGSSGLDDLLLALAELRDRDFSVSVFGEGSRRAALEVQTRDLRIDGRVTFRGWPDAEDRIARYRGAHTFVQAARIEPFAEELLRALVAGCVGIVEYQADSSAHELIVHRDRHFRVTDPEEIADALLAAGDIDRQTASTEFDEYDHETVLERYLDLYRELGRRFGWL
ncbi:glycosyltransferase [Halococcoides cellulosivorans]|uniref:Glycosyl transferase family 1 n=1 Tax=Halococcoides cellulosivorans TaxID=1679096 RepID=A0A2R4WZX7_9EURY|nr:glycosyltransferase [Halococcoides cellulosivorans]AWB27093.1 glycosyl transferase family 1 [Halococcoides cellulosivorans]